MNNEGGMKRSKKKEKGEKEEKIVTFQRFSLKESLYFYFHDTRSSY